MKVRVFGCRKFRHLSGEQQDRELNDKEVLFLERHRAVCPACEESEETSCMALNMLRAATLEVESTYQEDQQFDLRVLRRTKIRVVKESLQYWRPALVGGAIAATVIFAGLQMMTHGNDAKKFRPIGSARLETRSTTNQPLLELSSNHLELR